MKIFTNKIKKMKEENEQLKFNNPDEWFHKKAMFLVKTYGAAYLTGAVAATVGCYIKFPTKVRIGLIAGGTATAVVSSALLAKSWNKYVDELQEARDQKKRNEDESIPVEFEVEETE